jgi:CRP-like cAMP-binding protein
MCRGIQALRDNPWFDGFPQVALEELARAGQVRRFKDKEYLVRRGEQPIGLGVILQGCVRSGSLSADGHEFTFSLLKPGALIWLISALDGQGTVNDAIAYGDTEIWVIPRAAYLRVLQHTPELYGYFVQMLCYRMRKAHSLVEELALVPLQQRLPRQLCTLACAESGGRTDMGEIILDVTQQDLAVLLGVTRPIVNRALKELELEGLIAVRYHKVVVRDFAALHARCQGKALFVL